MSRFRAAADLSYHAGQALRHAIMVEAYLTHGVETADVLIMVASDLEKCAQALLDYRNGIMKRDGIHEQK
jgi:hypothetical protein